METSIRIGERLFHLKYENNFVYFKDPETGIWISCQNDEFKNLNKVQVHEIGIQCLKSQGFID